jgi:hypothetical protein
MQNLRRKKEMKKFVGGILIAVCLVWTGTVMAADQNNAPAILTSLQNSENVVALDDKSMDQIQGTFFCLPEGHPTFGEAVCMLLKVPEDGRLDAIRCTFYKHVDYFKAEILKCICPPPAAP